MLNAHGEAHHAGGDTGFAQLIIGQLAVGGAGGMENAGADVGHVNLEGDHFKAVDKARAGFPSTFEGEGDDAAAPFGHVLVGQGFLRVAGQARIIDGFHGGMLFQIGGDGFGIAAVAFHAQGQGFETLIDVERALRALAAAHIAHELHARLDDVGGLAKGLGVDEAVVGRIGLGKFGELAGGQSKLPLSTMTPPT